MTKKAKKQGFTLVEIMIVVAIIGLLAAIGIPSFKKARQGAMQKSAINNTRLINSAVDQYAMDQGLTDGATVAPSSYLEYIKGGTNSLSVGSVDAPTDSGTVGTDLEASTIYADLF